MAGIKPALITGSNAKIQIDGKTIAYATDIQYSVDTAVIPVEVMGRYEVVTNEPIATSVAGSFTVVRYSSAVKDSGLPNASATGNGVGNLAGNMKNAFNPGQMLSTQTVDIIIYQKKKESATAAGDVQEVLKITDCRLTRLSGSINKRGILTEGYSFVGVLFDDDSFEASGSGTGTDLT